MFGPERWSPSISAFRKEQAIENQNRAMSVYPVCKLVLGYVWHWRRGRRVALCLLLAQLHHGLLKDILFFCLLPFFPPDADGDKFRVGWKRQLCFGVGSCLGKVAMWKMSVGWDWWHEPSDFMVLPFWGGKQTLFSL